MLIELPLKYISPNWSWIFFLSNTLDISTITWNIVQFKHVFFLINISIKMFMKVLRASHAHFASYMCSFSRGGTIGTQTGWWFDAGSGVIGWREPLLLQVKCCMATDRSAFHLASPVARRWSVSVDPGLMQEHLGTHCLEENLAICWFDCFIHQGRVRASWFPTHYSFHRQV